MQPIYKLGVLLTDIQSIFQKRFAHANFNRWGYGLSQMGSEIKDLTSFA